MLTSKLYVCYAVLFYKLTLLTKCTCSRVPFLVKFGCKFAVKVVENIYEEACNFTKHELLHRCFSRIWLQVSPGKSFKKHCFLFWKIYILTEDIHIILAVLFLLSYLKYSSKKGGLRSKQFEQWVLYKQVWALVNKALTRYIFPTLLNPIFWEF